MQAGVNCHKAHTSSSIGIGYAVKTLQDTTRTGGQESIGDGGVADVEQEKIHERLRRSDHIFLRRDKLHNGAVQFRSLPTIHGLLCRGIPIKGLGYVVCQVAHIASPPVSTIQEANEGVDVGSASSASGDDLVWYDMYRVFDIMERCVWLDYETEWQSRLLQKRVCGGHGIERGSNILWRAVCIRRGCDGRLE